MFKKRVILFLSMVIFGFGSARSEDQPQKPKKFRLDYGAELRIFGVNYTPLVSQVLFLPQAMRTVPTHAGDSWFGVPGTPRVIPNDRIRVGLKTGVNIFSVAPQVCFWERFYIRGGGNLQLGGRDSPTVGNIREINQYGKPERGYGTSLVYYAVLQQKRVALVPFGEMEVKLTRNVALLGGYTTEKRRFSVETGYDRSNSLETYAVYPLLRQTSRWSYVGVKLGVPVVGLVVFAGPARHSSNLELSGAGTLIDSKQKTFQFGAALYFNLTRAILRDGVF